MLFCLWSFSAMLDFFLFSNTRQSSWFYFFSTEVGLLDPASTLPDVIFPSSLGVLILSEMGRAEGAGRVWEQKWKLPITSRMKHVYTSFLARYKPRKYQQSCKGRWKEDSRGLVSLSLNILVIFKMPVERCGDSRNRNVCWRQAVSCGALLQGHLPALFLSVHLFLSREYI